MSENSNPEPLSGSGTVPGGQFDWGGRLPNSNGGAMVTSAWIETRRRAQEQMVASLRDRQVEQTRKVGSSDPWPRMEGPSLNG